MNIGDVHEYGSGSLATPNIETNIDFESFAGGPTFTPPYAVVVPPNVFVDVQGTFVGVIDINGTDYPIFSDVNAGGSLTDPVLFVITPVGFNTANLPPNLNAATSSSLTECFLTGTRIATPEGETAVEDLQIGDQVLTADGATVPVRWIGWQKVVCAFQPPERLMPVRVHAGALGHCLPKRDLTLTTDHALCVDGMLINAGALVNGTTVTLVPLSEFDDSYTVYHVETENHDLILAEGTAAETYIDYQGRSSFHNYDEYLALYGEEPIIDEMELPRISTARLVPQATRNRLASETAA